MGTLQELNKTCQEVKVLRVNDTEVKDKKVDISTKTIGEKFTLRLDKPYPIRFIAVKFGDNKTQYQIRCYSRDFVSTKTGDYEVFDLDTFTGKNLEIIARGNFNDDDKGSVNIEDIKLFCENKTMETLQKDKQKTAKEAGVKLTGKQKIIDDITVMSLESDPGVEKALENNEEFTTKGKGRVLRFTLPGKCVITEISAKTKQDSQLIGLAGKTYEFSKGKDLEIKDLIITHNIDMILEGGHKTDNNSIYAVKFKGELTE